MTSTLNTDRPPIVTAPDDEAVNPHQDARSTSLFDNTPLRTLLIDGRQFFASTDVCRALKLKIGGRITSAKYLRGVAPEHRGYHPFPTTSGVQQCAILSLEGARMLAKRRDRRIDRTFRAFLAREFSGS